MEELAESVRKFAEEREWVKFHSPKNLVMALNVEAGELMENFQWLTEEQSRALPPEKLEAVKDEIGDVLIYLVNLCDKLGVDPVECAREKMTKSAAKYPVEAVRGRAVKYTEL